MLLAVLQQSLQFLLQAVTMLQTPVVTVAQPFGLLLSWCGVTYEDTGVLLVLWGVL